MLGTNATQWGMAGAVIAAPQDSATLFYNPAGLTQLGMDEVRFDMGVGLLNPPREVNGVESDSNIYMIPNGAIAFPVSDRVTLGMGMGGISGMGVDFPEGATSNTTVTNLQIFKLAPGFGYRVNDSLSLGAALHINYQSLAMYFSNMPTLMGPIDLFLPQNQVYGVGLGIGGTYNINKNWRVAGTYTSEQYMDEFRWNTEDGKYSMKLNGPAQTALGTAFTNGDLLIEFDIKHIAFGDVMDTVILNSPTMGPMPMAFGWESQLVYALGAQYRLNETFTVRGGINYGKSPIDPEDVQMNVGSPAISEWHLAMGLTQKLTKHVSTSFSYTHAFENEITSSDGSTTISLSQNLLHFQLTYSN
jgi:long-chain fatty acid transport protein